MGNIVLHRNLETIRKKWRMTQAEIGAMFGKSRASWYYYEGGKNQPSLELIVKLSKLTGFTIGDLCTVKLDRDDVPKSPLQKPPPYSSPSVANEPPTEYMKSAPDDLYNLNKLIKEVEALRLEVERLKIMIKKIEDPRDDVSPG